MANILVTIISEQTIQNVLFIKQLMEVEKMKFDKFIFFSSQKMFNRHFGKWVAEVCKIDFDKIELQDKEEDDILAINAALLARIQNREDSYFVNITGGTKLMSTAVYQFFNSSNFPNAKNFYLPAGKNTYIEIDNSKEAEIIKIEYQLSVEEYMNAYGVKILKKQDNLVVENSSFTKNFITRFTNLKPELKSLRVLTDARDYKWNEIPNSNKVQQLLDNIQFSLKKRDGLSFGELRYLAFAGSIEEMIFSKIKSMLSLNNENILLGVEIDKEGVNRYRPNDWPFYKNDNELDIVFIFNNVLYVIECKSNILKNDFNEIVYTLAAIKDNRNGFGLFVNSYIYCQSKILRKDGDFNQDFYWIYNERATLHNIKLTDIKNIDEEIIKLLPK